MEKACLLRIKAPLKENKMNTTKILKKYKGSIICSLIFIGALFLRMNTTEDSGNKIISPLLYISIITFMIVFVSELYKFVIYPVETEKPLTVIDKLRNDKMMNEIIKETKRGIVVFGSAGSGRQVSVIRDNIEKISYLIDYDLLTAYHGASIEMQSKIDRFFNVHRPHEVMELYVKWTEEYYSKTNENPFELDRNYKVIRISSTEFKKTIFSNIFNLKSQQTI